MPKSPNFIRIKADVLRLVGMIPPGRVTTYGTIGADLDVMARHVAYILAMLTDDEATQIPWHRVVGDQGLLKSTKHRPATVQRSLLEAEGTTIDTRGRVVDFPDRLFEFS